MIKSAITVNLVEEARGGPFVFWDGIPAACQRSAELGYNAIEILAPQQSCRWCRVPKNAIDTQRQAAGQPIPHEHLKRRITRPRFEPARDTSATFISWTRTVRPPG